MEAAKAKEQGTTENTFAKPTLKVDTASQNQNGDQAQPAKPKIVHLGTLGNAKKRTREQMEASTKGATLTGKTENSNSNTENNSDKANGTKEKVPGSITPESKVTKVDESGHVEKMAKNA